MLRHAIAAGLILLATSRIDPAAGETTSRIAVCPAACAMNANTQPGMRDAMDDGVARIAVRATAPPAEGPALNERDLVSLYLLLSLQSKAYGGPQ